MLNSRYHDFKHDLFVSLRTSTGGLLCMQQASIIKVIWSDFLKHFVCVNEGLSVKVSRETAWDLMRYQII